MPKKVNKVDKLESEMIKQFQDKARKFASLMSAQLYRNKKKGGWSQLTPEHMLYRIRQELKELEGEVNWREECGSESSDLFIAMEAADVANFAMMIVDNTVGMDKARKIARKIKELPPEE